MRTIALFNDTGSFHHAGCLAVSQAHLKMLKCREISVKHRFYLGQWQDLWLGDKEASLQAVIDSDLFSIVNSVDAVVVNGEGTIHHGAGLHLLAILDAAQQIGKQTYIVNSVFQECSSFKTVLSRLEDFTVRDKFSSLYLENMGIKHRLVLDSILEADFVKEPDRDLSGKIVITDFHHSKSKVGDTLQRLLIELGDQAVYYPLEAPERFDDWQYLVANLRQAKLVVTGRHHGVYMAALAGVPFVALPSNTWKIEGTLALFTPNLPICEVYSDLVAACKAATKNKSLYDEFSLFLSSAIPLSTFNLLEKNLNKGFKNVIKTIFDRLLQ